MKITTTTYRCDCCHKETSETDLGKVSMPIVAHYEDGPRLMVKDMDFCIECANRFTKLYYEIADEHNYSGIQAVMM